MISLAELRARNASGGLPEPQARPSGGLSLAQLRAAKAAGAPPVAAPVQAQPPEPMAPPPIQPQPLPELPTEAQRAETIGLDQGLARLQAKQAAIPEALAVPGWMAAQAAQQPEPVPVPQPGMSAAPESWWERMRASSEANPGLSRNLAGLLSDQIRRVDPATGRLMSPEEQRQDRLGRQAREAVRSGAAVNPNVLENLTPEQAAALGIGRERKAAVAQAETPFEWSQLGGILGDLGRRALELDPELIGILASELTDPIALATGAIGSRGTLPARLLKLGAAGAGYEAAAGAAEQKATGGAVDDWAEVGLRAGGGAAGGMAGGMAFELLQSAGLGAWRKFRAGGKLTPDEQAVANAAAEAGAVEFGPDGEVLTGKLPGQMAEDAGLRTQAKDGPRVDPIVGKRLDEVPVSELPPLPGDPDAGLRQPAPTSGYAPRSKIREANIEPLRPEPGEAVTVGSPMERQVSELERLAEATPDPEVKRILRQQAAALDTRRKARSEQARARMERLRTVEVEQDDLLTAIRKWGGIDTELETDYAGRFKHLPRPRPGLGGIERPGRGLSLDDLAEKAAEAGYISAHDAQELDQLLLRAETGEPIWSRGKQDFADVVEPAGDPDAPAGFGSDADFEWDDVGAIPPDGGWAIDTDSGAAVKTEPFTLDDLKRLEEEEAYAQKWFEQEGAEAGPEAPAGDTAVSGAGPAGPGREPAGNGRGARSAGVPEGMADQIERRPGVEPEPGEAFGLTGETPEQLRARAEAERAAEAEAARLEREAEQRARADAEREGFTLTGSDRPVDELEARGQANLFDESPTIKERFPVGDDYGNPDSVQARKAVDTSRNLDLFNDLEPAPAVPAQRAQAQDNFLSQYVHQETGQVRVGTDRVTSPEDAAHILAPFRKHGDETLLALATDDDGKVLSVIRHSKGTKDASAAYPSGIVGAVASTPGATRFWLGHNHPSGSPVPSAADVRITEAVQRTLDATGITLDGHVVLGQGRKAWAFASDAVQDLSADVPGDLIKTRALPRGIGVPVTERVVRKRLPSDAPAVDGPDSAAGLADSLETKTGLALLDNKHRYVGAVSIAPEEMAALRKGNIPRRIFEAVDKTNAAAALILYDGNRLAARNLARAVNAGKPVRLLDAIDTSTSPPSSSAQLGSGIESSAGTFYANPFGRAAEFGADLARMAIRAPGQSAFSGFAGGTAAAIFGADEDRPLFSPRWWLEVAAGASAAAIGMQALRKLRVAGKDSFTREAFDRLATRINRNDWFGRGPDALIDLKRKQRVLRQMLDRQTAEVGAELMKQFSPAERVQIADIIEGRGVTGASARVMAQARVLDEFLVDAGREMQALGMLPEDMDIDGGYLHRYYAKHLGTDSTFREAKGQSISGSWSIRRGTTEGYGLEFLSPGARALADQMAELDAERAALAKRLRKLERTNPPREDQDLFLEENARQIEETAEQLDEVDGALKDLRQRELVEMGGIQEGRPRSFFFLPNEVGRVQPEPKQRASHVLKDQPEAGAVDARAMPEVPGVSDLEPSDRVWTMDQIQGGEVRLHRDWTKAEREQWGEIVDAGYRYTRGMAEVSHDLSLAQLFDAVARRGDWVRDTDPGKGWTQVPASSVPGGRLKRYGALSGKWVRDDVWAGINSYGRPVRVLGKAGQAVIPGTGATVEQAYRYLLGKWKLYKTVYNPVTHFNNTFSNVEMLTQAGYSGRDLVNAWSEMRRGEASAIWREARDAGLFGTTWTDSILSSDGQKISGLAELAEAMRNQPDVEDAQLAMNFVLRAKQAFIESADAVRGAEGPWKTGAELAKAAGRPVLAGLRQANRPLKAATEAATRLYRFEDEWFKMAAYMAERARGADIDTAVNAAERFFFDYTDLPKAIKVAREFPIGSPFISYTWKALPAVARNAIENPERVVGLIALYEAVNYAGMLTEGMPQDRYWETMYGYEDEQGRAVPGEQDLLPPWDRGRTAWGALKSVHIPGMDGYMLSLANAHAAGNPFAGEAGDRALSLDIPGLAGFWGSDLLGSNPARALLDVAVLNEDWKGKQIYSPEASTEEKTRRALAYLYRAWAPSNALVPGGWHQDKIIEGLANDAAQAPDGVAASVVDAANRFSESIGMGRYTGLDNMGNPIETRDAVAGSLGVKLRPFRPEQSAQYQRWAGSTRLRDLGKWWAARKREFNKGRITREQYEQYLDWYEQRKREITEETDALPGRAVRNLREQGRGETQRTN